MNLLTKLSEKFKNMSNETKKRIAATMLAGSMVFSGLGMAGCKNSNNTTNNNGSSIQTPGGDNGGTQNNNGGSQNSGNNGDNQNNKYANYSQILQNVLTDNYYYGLISNANSHDDNFVYNNPQYQPIPYGFLENEGFDISKLKNKQISCSSELFSINNDLFVEVKVEKSASTNYYVNYILKYALTEKEMDELNKLFASVYYSTYENATYFQAPFFVQELSYLKEPELLSVSYATSDCNNSANDFFNKKEFLSKNHISSYIKSEKVENSQTIYHYYLIRPRIINAKGNSKLGVVKMHTAGHSSFYDGDKFVLSSNQLGTSGKISAENRTKFEESVQSIIAYTTRNHYFKDVNNNNSLESVFGK